MSNTSHTKRLKVIALNLIGISIVYGISFCYGHYVRNDLAGEPVKFSDEISLAAKTYDISPALIAAVIHAESNFYPRARSNAGAKGLMQIIPPTQRYLKLRNVFDPKQNIFAGSKYLRELLDRFGGNLIAAIAAYNAGPGAVEKHDGIPPYKETREYVKKVFLHYNHYQRVFASNPFMS